MSTMSQRGVTSEPVESGSPAPPAGRSRRGVGSLVAVGSATVLIAGCALWGRWLDSNGYSLHLGNAWPVAGHWQTRLTWWTVVLVVGAGLWVWQGPKLARRLSWRRLLAVVFLVAVCWPIALALLDGPDALTAPLLTPYEYLNDVVRVTDLSTFLSGFNAHVMDPPRWTTHVSGHPPGFLGLLTVMDRIGLGGAAPAAALCIVGGAAAAPATLSTTRVLGGEELARRAAPFSAMAPAALWIATSADAFFAGVAAVGVCLLAHAANSMNRRADLAALGGGALLGASLFLSYGLTLIGLVALGVVLVRRRVRPLLIGGAAVVALLALAWMAGFNWFEGLDLATQRVRMGQGWIDRPAWYFWFANPAGLALAVGPAVVAALAWIRRDRFAVIPLCVLAAVAAALVSGLSVGEAERIYLPFAVWLLPLAGLLPLRGARWWLSAQAATAIAIASLLVLWW